MGRIANFFKFCHVINCCTRFLGCFIPRGLLGFLACEQAPSQPNKERESVDILLMPLFCDTSSWYHDMIGEIADCC